jgi:hypothetical protein
MKCLTPEEISNWIKVNGQIEDPYLGESEPIYRVQCTAPLNYFAIEYFLKSMMNLGFSEADMLVQPTDWEPTEDCRDFIINAIRHEIGETRPIEQAPGFLVTPAEREKAVAIVAVTTCFKWKSYLYGSNNQMVLYNWEGEIFDFWTNSEAKNKEFRNLMQSFELADVKDDTEVN